MPIDSQLLTLGYTILAGLVGVVFFLGRASARLDRVENDHRDIQASLVRIFDRMEKLGQHPADCTAFRQRPPER